MYPHEYRHFMCRKIDTILAGIERDGFPSHCVEIGFGDGKLTVVFPVMGARYGYRTIEFKDTVQPRQIIDEVVDWMKDDQYFNRDN